MMEFIFRSGPIMQRVYDHLLHTRLGALGLYNSSTRMHVQPWTRIEVRKVGGVLLLSQSRTRDLG